MNQDRQVAIADNKESRDITVLRIASAATNSASKFFTDRVQVTTVAIQDLDRKMHDKLGLHQIKNIQLSVYIQFKDDKALSFGSRDEFERCDMQTDAQTHLVTLKWAFMFDATGSGQNQLHSVYVRISENPNPGLVLQRMFSGHVDDIHSLDNETFAPVSCKVDFTDGRFSNELLTLVSDWVRALPKAEASFGLINWLQKKQQPIMRFIHGTLPAVAILGYSGLWLGCLQAEQTSSIRVAVAWILGGTVVFHFSQYVATLLNKVFERQTDYICNVPVFQITSGDRQNMTRYLAKSQKSLFKLGSAGLLYGALKAVGFYLASFFIRG